MVPKTSIYSRIRAIPTSFNGTYYRSKLEAQWALFMGLIKLPFVYEPEQFDLQKFRYTPDFRIDRHIYFEVKPAVIPVNTFDKVALLATSHRVMVYVCAGDFWNGISLLQITPTGVLTTGYDIRYCANCNSIKITNSEVCPSCYRYVYKYDKEKERVKRHKFKKPEASKTS